MKCLSISGITLSALLNNERTHGQSIFNGKGQSFGKGFSRTMNFLIGNNDKFVIITIQQFIMIVYKILKIIRLRTHIDNYTYSKVNSAKIQNIAFKQNENFSHPTSIGPSVDAAVETKFNPNPLIGTVPFQELVAIL